MTVRDRPCRQFCNRRDCAPTKCQGIVVYGRDDPRFWLGRGSEPVAGKPFGWAHNMERRAIADHLKRRGRWRDGWSEFHVSKLQSRLQRSYHARKPRIGATVIDARGTALGFTEDDLALILDKFDRANDPAAQAVYSKAAAMLQAQQKKRTP